MLRGMRRGCGVQFLDARFLIGPCFLLLSACASSTTGDFGRRSDTIVTNSILPRTGLISAWLRGEPVSLSPFTDDEIEMRDRAWRFLLPAHDKANLQTRLAELSASRVLPPLQHSARNHYHLLLLSEDYRSVVSRYQKLGQDIEADRLLMLPFSQVTARVCTADRMRVQNLNQIKDLNPTQRQQVIARVAENRMLVDWVRRDMREKAASYRYALEHLTVEAPMREAIQAEQALIALESAQQTLDYWDGCGENPVSLPPRGGVPGRGSPRVSLGQEPERYNPASPSEVTDRRGVLDTAKPPK